MMAEYALFQIFKETKISENMALKAGLIRDEKQRQYPLNIAEIAEILQIPYRKESWLRTNIKGSRDMNDPKKYMLTKRNQSDDIYLHAAVPASNAQLHTDRNESWYICQ